MQCRVSRAVVFGCAALVSVAGVGLAQQGTDDGSGGQKQSGSVQRVKRPAQAQSSGQAAAAQRIEASGAAPIGGPGAIRIARNSDQRFSREELDRLIEEVKLDDVQIVLVESLFQGYRDATSDGVKSVAAYRSGEAFANGKQEEQDQEKLMAQFRKSQEAEKKWRNDRRRLEEAFFADIENLLSKEQSERTWPSYERGYRRRTQLAQRAQLPGEGVDLIAMVGAIEVADESQAMIAPILSQYAMELDRGIVSRNEYLDAITDEMDQMALGNIETPEGDPDRMMGLNQKAREKRVALVDTNRRYCGMLASSLGPAMGQALQDRFNEKSFPRIFAPTAADRFLEQVLGSDSLSGDQVARLNSVKSDYEQRVGFVNKEWLDLELEKDKEMRKPAEEREKDRKSDDGPQISMVMMSSSGDGNMMVHESPPSDIVDRIFEVRTRKHQLVQETIDRVYDILNDGQRQSLPKPTVREPRRGGSGFMMTTFSGPDGEEFDLDFGEVIIDLGDVFQDIDLEQLMEDGGGAITIQSVQNGTTEGGDGEVQAVREVQIQIGTSGDEAADGDEKETEEGGGGG